MKKVLIIHTEGNIFNNPTLCSMIDMLLENNIEVNLRYRKNSLVYKDSKNLKFIPYGFLFDLLNKLIMNKLSISAMVYLLVFFENIFVYNNNFQIIIGVDRDGLIAAAFLSKITKSPVIFFSFEIMFESETSKNFKKLEKKASTQVEKWYVQDHVRAKCLEEENNLDLSRCVFVPLSSPGIGRLSAKRLRDALGIPKEKKVAMAMGSISSWSMTDEIIRSTEMWPEDWVLILHDRYGRTREEIELLGVEEKYFSNNKIYVSSASSLRIDDMSEILSGVDIGLAFYCPDNKSPYTGNNLKYIGLSSGKISTFLRYGIPVIMNDVGLYAELATAHGFGLVADSMSDLARLLEKAGGQSMNFAAQKFFAECLDFNIYKEKIWNDMSAYIT